MQLRGAGNRHDPGLSGEQPGECDLPGCGANPLGNALQTIDEDLICLAILCIEAWHRVPEVGAVERGRCCDLAGQESFAERTERHEANPELFESWQHFLLRLAIPQ